MNWKGPPAPNCPAATTLHSVSGSNSACGGNHQTPLNSASPNRVIFHRCAGRRLPGRAGVYMVRAIRDDHSHVMTSSKPANPIKLMVVDDHPAFRMGLVALIESQPDMTLVAE